jgi:Cu2+-exporting ATPase
MEHENHSMHSGMKHEMPNQPMQGMQHGGSMHMMHTGMFKRRFFVCLALTLPVLVLSQAIQTWFHYSLSIPFQSYILLGLAVVIYVYGGWPFLKGLTDELRRLQPGMMTLIATAI